MNHEREDPPQDPESIGEAPSEVFPVRPFRHPDGPRILEAVKAGDLETVRRMLEAVPDLLFVEDDSYVSPVEAAADTHAEIADYLAHMALGRLKEGSIPETYLREAIHDLGEAAQALGGYRGCEKFRIEAEPVVAAFLTHDDPGIRDIAISVLGLHWDMSHYVPVFQQMCQNDPDEDVRYMAVTAVGWVRRGSRDRGAARFLVGIFRNPGFQPAWIRKNAYHALLELWYGFDEAFAQMGRLNEKEYLLRATADQAGTPREGAQPRPQRRNLWEECADWDSVAEVERELQAEDEP